ncbi:PAS domain S-box protein [Candidatus Obscuribacterales bacterium]|nr:PAS domain S-box protein [Candidatus Obscuribacterales bacterium]MBX3154077.1 PAS domain S-box protein [Candidatus Obscuribacterales bacterium]
MSDNEQKPAFSLKLSHQGLLLVIALLAIEFVFVGSLLNLLHAAEVEARSQEHFRKIIGATNRLIELNYVAVYAIRDYVATKDRYHERKYDASVKEMKRSLDVLEKSLKTEPYQLELVHRIRSKFNVAFSVADRARDVIDGNGSLLELADIMKSKGEFQQLNRQLIPDFQDLLRAERRIEEKSPALQRKWREETKKLLTWGLVLNVVIAIAIASFFTRSIITRLAVLVDNTRRLQAREALRPRLAGNDEIAQLDRVFHDMAFELTEAARKEQLALNDAKDAEARIRQVINSMPTGVLSTDRGGTILFANPRVSSMFGYSTSDLRGMHFSKLLPTVDLRRGEEGGGMPHLYNELKDKSMEVRATTSSNTQVDVDLSITPFDIKGEKRFLITLLDITEKLEILRMRQAFVAMVSHELRTPLNSVQGFLELLEMGVFGDLSNEARDGSVRASANIERLITLINDLLDLEKIESGTISLTPDDCDVGETVKRAVDAVNDLADKKKIKIEIAEMPESTYYFDQDRIVQVLVNFLSNALKFTPEGGEITITSQERSSAKSGGENILELSVVDQGPGIPPLYRDIIFERFQQVKDESGHKGGTGLGLAICKAIVEQHKGSIGVDCDREIGSRFWFTIPADWDIDEDGDDTQT